MDKEYHEYLDDMKKGIERSDYRELIDRFNEQVGNPGWTGSKMQYLRMIVEEMKKRGWDLSAIQSIDPDSNSMSTSFKHRIKLRRNRVRIIR